ncbi:CDGSH iron-sulfur domain-containing protein [Geothermobacter hydrogeniphilus]|uniref:Iron-binding zinc finger CDGSH type domain-containing protein n=1 Tax=Geothermobacter hydrogeniphilus TaxID=1969733 RepID=A0A1X0YA92_9BACT|nr:CDGSH iron-sulfur domain-containing protein [Geothermobacter hydrogeniphilus]ORJ62121.1 hypothetical protein B5V00_05055 [Geothermobacter hydrogeniphilus]
MTKPNTDAGMPIAITLDPGTYDRCACGGSQNLPFCDGSHSSDGPRPIRFKITRRQKVYLCSCGKTGNRPFCDGGCGFSPDSES